jgi:hypothetical protein
MQDPPVRMTWQRAARFRRQTLTNGWGVSIKPRHWRRTFEKPRLNISITKNHDFLGNFFPFTLIASWTRIDTKSDRWDPPISAKLVLYVLTWTGTHLSVQLKIKMEKWKKNKSSLTSTHLPATPTTGTPPPTTTSRAAGPPRPKLAASRPPALAAPRPHHAILHSPSHGRCSAPSPRRPELVAPCCLDIAAQSSSPTGQEWGRGVDPPEMG